MTLYNFRMIKFIFAILACAAIATLTLVAIARGPQQCEYGGFLAMSGKNCTCIGNWYETEPFYGVPDEVHVGKCIGYKI